MKKQLVVQRFTLLILSFCMSGFVFTQKNVAITIDDIPNTRQFKNDKNTSVLLNELDALQIPIAIFINEGKVYSTGSSERNTELLEDWCSKEYITLGNHSFGHLRYSDTSLDDYINDILKGETLTREIAHTHSKSLHHFRFPFNDLGIDSLQQAKIDSALRTLNYNITPFTIESSDYMFNLIYTNHLSKGELKEAKEIGDLYVSKTIDFFNFYDSLSQQIYGRSVNQIYLCHDNALNAKFLPKLIKQLKEANYNFISLDEALSDNVYSQENVYFKKWGISWFYRWMKTPDERKKWMASEPSMIDVEQAFEELNKNN